MTTRQTDTSHGDWVQYYQRDVAAQPPGGGGGVPTRFDSPVVYSTTAVTATVTPAGSGGGGAQPAGEGRAGRATSRRRSRPSRKAPTNLINTDAANFRDIVQRYTGAPQETFQAGYHLKAASAAGGAGGGPDTLRFNLSAATVLPQQPAAFPYGSHQQQLYLQYQQRHERPPFTLGGGAEDADLFLQGFGGGQPQRGFVEASEGYLMEGTSSSQVLPRGPAAGGGRTTGGLFL